MQKARCCSIHLPTSHLRVSQCYNIHLTQPIIVASLVATMVRHVERKALQIHNLYVVVFKKTLDPSF
jgi:hypothetical protein